MDNYSDFQTYLFISKKKLIISVYLSSNEKIYDKEFIFEQDSKELILEKIDNFLDQNILKIEKKLKNFVEKIFLILDLDIFLPIEISIKRNVYKNNIRLNNLNHLLHDVKDYCRKTIDDRKIVHMIIDNYKIDDKDYNFLPKSVECKNLSLDVRFLCISSEFIKSLERILKKYQISLNQISSGDYVRGFLSDHDKDFFLMAKKLIDGHNPNEVMLIDKTNKNQGFFEKFFNLFN
jgi:hypothetical protein